MYTNYRNSLMYSSAIHSVCTVCVSVNVHLYTVLYIHIHVCMCNVLSLPPSLHCRVPDIFDMTGPPHGSLGSLGSLGSISIPSIPSLPSFSSSHHSSIPPGHHDMGSLSMHEQMGPGSHPHSGGFQQQNGGMGTGPGQNGYEQQQMPVMRSGGITIALRTPLQTGQPFPTPSTTFACISEMRTPH